MSILLLFGVWLPDDIMAEFGTIRRVTQWGT
jgi:hypothetical protein